MLDLCLEGLDLLSISVRGLPFIIRGENPLFVVVGGFVHELHGSDVYGTILVLVLNRRDVVVELFVGAGFVPLEQVHQEVLCGSLPGVEPIH